MLYSGKHKTTGMNVQVVCDFGGRLAWVSDPIEGRRHDSAALQICAVLDTLDASNWMGDKGYIGNGMLTPIRKPPFRKLLDWEKAFNKQVNQIRYLIERAIANLKTWRILHTDYRRPQGPGVVPVGGGLPEFVCAAWRSDVGARLLVIFGCQSLKIVPGSRARVYIVPVETCS